VLTYQPCLCSEVDTQERLRGEASAFYLEQCLHCGQGITTPWPTEQQLAEAYSSEYYSSETAKFNRLIETWTRFAARRRARSLIKKHGGGASTRILDYGCGRGILLNGFKQQGADVYGAERAGSGFESITDVHIANLDQLLADGERFDIVVLWHVLEHLSLPRDDLQKISELLLPGGSLFLEVPSFSSWQARLFGRHWFHLDFPRHLYHFTARSLQAAIQQAGFETVSLHTYAPDQQLYGFAQIALNAVPFLPHNHLYGLLKQRGSRGAWFGTLLYLPILVVLTVPALIELLLSVGASRGAVLTVHARKPNAKAGKLDSKATGTHDLKLGGQK